jgi:MSHA biogenesis protein MshN
VSVINKMLRDLDSRQAERPGLAATPDTRLGAVRDTLSVKSPEQWGLKAQSLRRVVQLVTTVLALCGVAAWWYLNQAASPQPPVQATRLAISSKPHSQSQPQPQPVSPSAPLVKNGLTEAPPPVVTAPVSVAAQPAVVSRPEPAKLPVTASVPAPKSGAAYVDFSLKMDNLLQHAPSPAVATRSPVSGTPRTASGPILSPSAPSEPLQATTAAPKAVASTTLTAPPSQARPPAAQEALAQAQQLWNAGSRLAAVDLLHEALALAERASLAGAPSGTNSVVASIARELARMELAEGRVSQVLVLLTRLEPMLSGVADIWAIRGNAAQRLGQHPASAAAYLMALKLRPNEPRWMLGAAVSLAAQGQTAAAAEMAEKARDGGALSPEVASYLRQLGVPLRER